jgi:hypothetical protein
MSKTFIPCGTDENLEGGYWVGQKTPEPPTFKGNWTPPTNYLMELTLRDYFAAMALQGICVFRDRNASYTYETLAQESYQIAGAMMKARGEKNG